MFWELFWISIWGPVWNFVIACIKQFFLSSQAKLQVGRPKFHHNSNLDIKQETSSSNSFQRTKVLLFFQMSDYIKGCGRPPKPKQDITQEDQEQIDSSSMGEGAFKDSGGTFGSLWPQWPPRTWCLTTILQDTSQPYINHHQVLMWEILHSPLLTWDGGGLFTVGSTSQKLSTFRKTI